jgi:hypothetical protein
LIQKKHNEAHCRRHSVASGLIPIKRSTRSESLIVPVKQFMRDLPRIIPLEQSEYIGSARIERPKGANPTSRATGAVAWMADPAVAWMADR